MDREREGHPVMDQAPKTGPLRLAAGDPWRNPNFVRLWAGETVSLLGSQITVLAIPLTAVLVLGATPIQMGLLGAAGYLPFLIITLPAGAWIDRRRRGPILIAANVARALLLVMVPVTAFVGLLRVEWLFLITLAVGVCTVAFEVAYLAYVPSVVSRDQLTTANGRIQASASVAQIGGPGLAGLLVSSLGAPLAVMVDAASFLFSALNLRSIRIHEPEPASRGDDSRDLFAEIRDGLSVTFGQPVLRAFACGAAMYNALFQAMEAVLLLYVTRTLGMGAATIGLLFAIGAIGSLIGALIAGRLADRFGLGGTIVGATLLGCWVPILIPLAGGSVEFVFLTIGVALFLGNLGVTIQNIHVVSLRQTITPDRLLGRMNASYRTLVWGAIPLGAIIGGILGEVIGLRATLAVAAILLTVVPMWVIRSPIPTMRVLPSSVGAGGLST